MTTTPAAMPAEPKFLQSQRKLRTDKTTALNEMLDYIDGLQSVAAHEHAEDDFICGGQNCVAYGEVKVGKDGILGIYSLKFNVRLATFSPGESMSIGTMFYKAPPSPAQEVTLSTVQFPLEV